MGRTVPESKIFLRVAESYQKSNGLAKLFAELASVHHPLDVFCDHVGFEIDFVAGLQG